jgi:alpha-D-ribose 1-methylphosphonate 5-triphosphate diphosphatase PhnM
VTATPAAGIDDRFGERTDLMRVRVTGNVPAVRPVWRTGARVEILWQSA